MRDGLTEEERAAIAAFRGPVTRVAPGVTALDAAREAGRARSMERERRLSQARRRAAARRSGG